MPIDDGGPAFPTANETGMSLRDYFAASIVQATTAQRRFVLEERGSLESVKSEIADVAYKVADAMLERRKF